MLYFARPKKTVLEIWANAQRDGRPAEYTGWSKKADTRFIFAITLSILDRFEIFLTAANSSKFPTKPVLGYPPHLKRVAALPCKT